MAENVPLPVNQVDIAVTGTAPPVLIEDMPSIQSGWLKRASDNPLLFNGPIYLTSDLKLSGGQLSGRAFRTDYATLMHWRGNATLQSTANVWHVFPLAAIESSDGHLIATRAASTTTNAGRVYFAGGTFDDEDVEDGKLQPHANMHREVLEETGLVLADMDAGPNLTLIRSNRFVCLFRRYVARQDSAALLGCIRQHVRGQDNPELDDGILIQTATDISDVMPPYMRAYCRWRLSLMP